MNQSYERKGPTLVNVYASIPYIMAPEVTTATKEDLDSKAALHVIPKLITPSSQRVNTRTEKGNRICRCPATNNGYPKLRASFRKSLGYWITRCMKIGKVSDRYMTNTFKVYFLTFPSYRVRFGILIYVPFFHYDRGHRGLGSAAGFLNNFIKNDVRRNDRGRKQWPPNGQVIQFDLWPRLGQRMHTAADTETMTRGTFWNFINASASIRNEKRRYIKFWFLFNFSMCFLFLKYIVWLFMFRLKKMCLVLFTFIGKWFSR